MLYLERVANWWDRQHQQSDEILQQWVNNYNSDLELYAKSAVAAILETSMVFGAGMIDTLRIGEGVKEGGWGYGKDALRLLTIAGPIARLGRLGLAKWTFDPGGNWCASVAMAKALRQTGISLFIKVSDVIAKTGGSPNSMGEFIPILKGLGARIKEVPVLQSIEELKKIVSANPRAVVLFGVAWNKGGHALYAFRNALGMFKIADRTGKVVGSLAELKNFYQGIEMALPQGSAVVVYNAVVTEATSIASMLAMEVNAYIYNENNQKKVVLMPVTH